MNDRETIIFNRIVAFRVLNVEIREAKRNGYTGDLVLVTMEDESEKDFFFPEYAYMSDAEMAEVIANNLRIETWNSVKQS